MLKAAKYFLILFAAFYIFTTCKKYPEDKFISFTTVKMRLEGEWQLERIEINDENVGYKYNDSLAPLTFKDYKFWFDFNSKIGNQKYQVLLINKSSKNESSALADVDVSGTSFDVFPKKGKSNLLIANSFDQISIKDVKSSSVLLNLIADNVFSGFFWQIKKLYGKELILEKNKNSNNYRITFKKIRNK
jgi:hypothetical protein